MLWWAIASFALALDPGPTVTLLTFSVAGLLWWLVMPWRIAVKWLAFAYTVVAGVALVFGLVLSAWSALEVTTRFVSLSVLTAMGFVYLAIFFASLDRIWIELDFGWKVAVAVMPLLLFMLFPQMSSKIEWTGWLVVIGCLAMPFALTLGVILAAHRDRPVGVDE